MSTSAKSKNNSNKRKTDDESAAPETPTPTSSKRQKVVEAGTVTPKAPPKVVAAPRVFPDPTTLASHLPTADTNFFAMAKMLQLNRSGRLTSEEYRGKAICLVSFISARRLGIVNILTNASERLDCGSEVVVTQVLSKEFGVAVHEIMRVSQGDAVGQQYLLFLDGNTEAVKKLPKQRITLQKGTWLQFNSLVGVGRWNVLEKPKGARGHVDWELLLVELNEVLPHTTRNQVIASVVAWSKECAPGEIEVLRDQKIVVEGGVYTGCWRLVVGVKFGSPTANALTSSVVHRTSMHIRDQATTSCYVAKIGLGNPCGSCGNWMHKKSSCPEVLSTVAEKAQAWIWSSTGRLAAPPKAKEPKKSKAKKGRTARKKSKAAQETRTTESESEERAATEEEDGEVQPEDEDDEDEA
ncbi:hypothetical protein AAF712_016365 [Marasmius tenuissimus]|uniref:EF-hand domain-containing protein n=1 Tax=Marasmius tenuissimus TaxID=585030 RepID=A0ABR2Z834_9AGAR